MNLILLYDTDFISPTHARLTGRRLKHLNDIVRIKKGQSLVVGKVNGLMGQGHVLSVSQEVIELDVHCDQPPPAALPLTLVLALPRPNVLKRTLVCATSLGVKHIIILNFNRVEKSLWHSSALAEEVISEQLVLGLEQGKDTIFPQVILKKGFKPFVQDELPSLMEGTLSLVAHPGVKTNCPSHVQQPVTLVIGPEGGLIDYEVDQLMVLGFQAVDLGARILRVESVLPFLVGKLF